MKTKQFNHKAIAVHCFNAVWDIMDQPLRRPEDLLEMLHLAHASLWHWTQVPDSTPTNLSVGYWQISRAYAVAEEFGNALKYAEVCIDVSKASGVTAFYKAYAREAAARACLGLHDYEKAKFHLESARAYAGEIPAEEMEMLEPDLEELEARA